MPGAGALGAIKGTSPLDGYGIHRYGNTESPARPSDSGRNKRRGRERYPNARLETFGLPPHVWQRAAAPKSIAIRTLNVLRVLVGAVVRDHTPIVYRALGIPVWGRGRIGIVTISIGVVSIPVRITPTPEGETDRECETRPMAMPA